MVEENKNDRWSCIVTEWEPKDIKRGLLLNFKNGGRVLVVQHSWDMNDDIDAWSLYGSDFSVIIPMTFTRKSLAEYLNKQNYVVRGA